MLMKSFIFYALPINDTNPDMTIGKSITVFISVKQSRPKLMMNKMILPFEETLKLLLIDPVLLNITSFVE